MQPFLVDFLTQASQSHEFYKKLCKILGKCCSISIKILQMGLLLPCHLIILLFISFHTKYSVLLLTCVLSSAGLKYRTCLDRLTNTRWDTCAGPVLLFRCCISPGSHQSRPSCSLLSLLVLGPQCNHKQMKCERLYRTFI